MHQQMERLPATMGKLISLQERSNSLDSLETKLSLTREECLVIQLKYEGARFRNMDSSDLSKWSKALLAKISVITGWVLPVDGLLSILIDQFQKKMTERYAYCTTEEVEYAFRMYGTTTKDWGKQINLSLIDEVMIPYLSKRSNLSKIEEQKLELPAAEVKEDISDDGMEDWLREVRKQIKDNQTSVEFMPMVIFDWCVKNGRLEKTNTEKMEFLIKAVEKRKAQLIGFYNDNDSEKNRATLSRFLKCLEEGYVQGDEIDNVKSLAKKIMLYEYISNNESLD